MKEFFEQMEELTNTSQLEADVETIVRFLILIIVLALIFYFWFKIRNYFAHRKDKDRINRDFLD